MNVNNGVCNQQAGATMERYFGFKWEWFEDHIRAESAAREAGRAFCFWPQKRGIVIDMVRELASLVEAKQLPASVLSGIGFARDRGDT